MRITKEMQQIIRKALTDNASLMESMLGGGYTLDNNDAVKIALRSCIKKSHSVLAALPPPPFEQ